MAKIKTLKQGGEELFPRTHVKAVMRANGMTLETYLGLLESRLAALEAGGITVTTADQLVSAVTLDSWKFNLIATTANAAYTSTAEAAASSGV